MAKTEFGADGRERLTREYYKVMLPVAYERITRDSKEMEADGASKEAIAEHAVKTFIECYAMAQTAVVVEENSINSEDGD